MTRYLMVRLAALIPVLLIVAVVSFLLLHLMPGDPASAMLPQTATLTEINELRRQLGLDRPLYVQFWRYFTKILRFDFGTSLFFRKPVVDVIVTRLESTVLLSLIAQALAVLIGIPFGVWAAARRGSWADHLLMSSALVTVSMPGFWLGLMFILLFAVRLGWFPVTGYVPLFQDPAQTWRYLVLPGVSLGLAHAAAIARMSRSSMLEVLNQDYIRTARAKGVSRFSMHFKHALRNAMIPMMAAIALSFSALLGGAAVTETVFTIPGVGSMMVDSVARRDYPMIQALLLLFAAVNVLVHLVIDFSYALLDPRIRYD